MLVLCATLLWFQNIELVVVVGSFMQGLGWEASAPEEAAFVASTPVPLIGREGGNAPGVSEEGRPQVLQRLWLFGNLGLRLTFPGSLGTLETSYPISNHTVGSFPFSFASPRCWSQKLRN